MIVQPQDPAPAFLGLLGVGALGTSVHLILQSSIPEKENVQS